MEPVTNAQLMNAIKLLTRKVEALQEEVAGLKRGHKPTASKSSSVRVPADWKYSTVTQEIVDAVLANPGLRSAAESLGMHEKNLSTLLKESGVPHLFGEKWSVALKRAISGSEVEDKFSYPEDWFEKKEKIKAHVEKYSLKETAQKLNTNYTILGRFIKMHC